MAWRAKVERFTVTCDGFLEILHPSQLRKVGGKSNGEAIEGYGAIAWRVKVKSLMMACDCFLEILHVSHLLDAGGNRDSEATEG
jgi:hypothetical protein